MVFRLDHIEAVCSSPDGLLRLAPTSSVIQATRHCQDHALGLTRPCFLNGRSLNANLKPFYLYASSCLVGRRSCPFYLYVLSLALPLQKRADLRSMLLKWGIVTIWTICPIAWRVLTNMDLRNFVTRLSTWVAAWASCYRELKGGRLLWRSLD